VFSAQAPCRSRKESDELGRIHYGGVSLCSPGLNERRELKSVR
jgi:hypothetical protein